VELQHPHRHRGSRDGAPESPAREEAIVGFAIAQPYKKHGRILTLDVLPEARRSGLGSTLLLECEKRLRQRNCTEVYLETAVNNEAALKLYHKQGYRTLRTLPDYYHGSGLDAFLLGKEL
jgi:ribosomal-protein-alanine N-acetyltransferase